MSGAEEDRKAFEQWGASSGVVTDFNRMVLPVSGAEIYTNRETNIAWQSRQAALAYRDRQQQATEPLLEGAELLGHTVYNSKDQTVTYKPLPAPPAPEEPKQ